MTSETKKVVFQPQGRQGDIEPGTTLLEAARRLGVEIESICGGNQTCGKCKIIVEEGDFAKFGVRSNADHLTSAGEREVEYAKKFDFKPGARLSCACEIVGDLVIRVPEESQIRKQVIRKSVGVEREISVDAAMRLYYVELPAPTLKDHRGDWQRLIDELERVHGLTNLRLDPIVLRRLQPVLGADNRRITVTVWDDSVPPENGESADSAMPEVVHVQSGFHDNIYGISVDVGTTTLAAHLCHLRTGEVIATASCMNPQVPYGEDLMSRVSYAMMNEDGTERMHKVVIEGLNGLITEVTEEAEISAADVVEMVIVANTTMHHLLLGVNPIELGGAPFSLVTHDAVDIKARDLNINIAPGGYIHLPPNEAGHVGADNVGVLVAEAPYKQERQQLVIDIGTNGELLLGNKEKMLSASSPTGPAFEGAQIKHGMRAAAGAIERIRIDPATLDVRFRIIGQEEWIDSSFLEAGDEAEAETKTDSKADARRKRQELLNPTLRASGICGSGIIEGIAELFMAGLVAPNGRFVDLDHPRVRTGLGDGGGMAEFVLAWPHETSTGEEIVVHSEDIRAIQLGKAALYAGAKLLMNRMELTEVDNIVLAGGFGSYIDPKHAMIIGLIPDCDLENVQAVGNAAGDGARMMLLDKNKRHESQWAARWVRYIETAVEPSFQDEFVGSLDIPHASDQFPHLDILMNEARSQWPEDRLAAYAAATDGGRAQRSSGDERAARRARRAKR